MEQINQIKNVTQQLRILFKVVQSHSKTVEKACGLSGAKLWMLYEIGQCPGIKVSQLATTLSIHRSTCSNMLDKLEDKELIIRDRSRSDQRTVHIFITDLGKNIIEKAPSPQSGKLNDALQQLESQQLTNLESSLQDVLDALSVDNKGAHSPFLLNKPTDFSYFFPLSSLF